MTIWVADSATLASNIIALLRHKIVLVQIYFLIFASISAELHERCSQIDKLRKRYEIHMTAMAPPEGEEEHSAAYYVISAAQVKPVLLFKYCYRSTRQDTVKLLKSPEFLTKKHNGYHS